MFENTSVVVKQWEYNVETDKKKSNIHNQLFASIFQS